MSGGPRIASLLIFILFLKQQIHDNSCAHESENRKTCAMSLICDSKKITAIVLIYVLLFIMQLHSFFTLIYLYIYVHFL